MNRLGLLVTVLMVLPLNLGPQLHAGILNGDFSQDHGLHWTVDFGGIVDFSGGQAKLVESDLADTRLSQQFTIAQGTSRLEIELHALLTEQVSMSGAFPDVLTFSLIDPLTLVSLVDVVPSTSTNFYIRDLLDSVVDGENASGVTVLGAALPLTIRLDLTSLTATGPVDAILQFELIGGGDFFDAAYTIDNISLISSPTIVPEPTSIAIWSIAIASIQIVRRRNKAS